MASEIQSGSIVIFRRPNPDELDRDGKQIPMKVLEVNGERVKVEAIVNMEIRPCYVHLLSELKLDE
jgi:hypothetical protein